MRAANMQALTNDMANRYPGITIYGIGDAAHKLEVSDHNEDDTPGSKSAQTDSDNVPEHRAIDCMLGNTFTSQEADALVAKVVSDKPSTDRLFYVIWNRHIWRRDGGWHREDYTEENPHTDHVHFSGWAPDDENASGWPVVYAANGSGPEPARLRLQWPSFIPPNEWWGDIKGPKPSHGGFYANERPYVVEIQKRLNVLGFNAGAEDGIFGPKTIAATTAWQMKYYASTTTLPGQIWKQDDWVRLFTY